LNCRRVPGPKRRGTISVELAATGDRPRRLPCFHGSCSGQRNLGPRRKHVGAIRGFTCFRGGNGQHTERLFRKGGTKGTGTLKSPVQSPFYPPSQDSRKQGPRRTGQQRLRSA